MATMVGFTVDKSGQSEAELGLHVHGPVKLRQQGPVKNLLDRDLMQFAPGNCDARVQVVDF